MLNRLFMARDPGLLAMRIAGADEATTSIALTSKVGIRSVFDDFRQCKFKRCGMAIERVLLPLLELLDEQSWCVTICRQLGWCVWWLL